MLTLQSWVEWETRLCYRFNRLNHHPVLSRLNAWATRLGDGYAMMIAAALAPLAYGQAGLQASARVLVAATTGVILYKIIKHKTARLRPCERQGDLHCTLAAPDYYSFPSGHTLHAFAFAVIALDLSNTLGVVVLPLALAVACSRVVLGLHYPTDVLAGGAIGAAIALGTLQLF